MGARERVFDKLAGGDLRSTGRSGEVAAEAVARPELAGVLVSLLNCPDPIVAMRAVDALEKASVGRPELLAPHKAAILRTAARATRKEIRWHLAQMIGRLDLNAREARRAAGLLTRYFRDPDSRIVRVCALDALWRQAKIHSALGPLAASLRDTALRDPAPSLRARARKLA